ILAARSCSLAPARRSEGSSFARPRRARDRRSPAGSAQVCRPAAPTRCMPLSLRSQEPRWQTCASWLAPRARGAGRLDRKLQLEEIRWRRLHRAHRGIGSTGRGDVLRRDLNALAALLLGIDLHLIRLQVRRRAVVLLLLAALFLLRLEQCDHDRAIGFRRSMAGLRLQYFVISLDRLFPSMVLRFGIAERELALDGLDLAERFGRGQEVEGAVGGNPAPHRIGKALSGRTVITPIERHSSLLV